ncbi:malate:quinone oxidoreductase, partial [Bradyrhizobium sp. INPA01-394B]|uniref:malate:quinone oxidoreductase n=1 Tax=Bradyrhizobium campsiandrae TaxID=1729892 RepID=UPI00165F1757|nr:malate:quinone oxidoreductase [Bradyrhizobium campsiandrae]
HSLLFGPYAGFSSKFLKHGSLLDLFESIRPANVKPLLSVARDLQSPILRIGLREIFVERREAMALRLQHLADQIFSQIEIV